MHPQLTDLKARVRSCNKSMADVAREADLDYAKLVRVVNGYAKSPEIVDKVETILTKWETE